MKRRLFVALDPPESIREELAAVSTPISRVRWLEPHQMHLTLAFLGDVDEETQAALETRLAGIRVAPFVLPIVGIGIFGHAQPKVIWAGVGRGNPHLFALHKKVIDAVLATGIRMDLRVFHPHITIARVEGASRASLKPFLQLHADTEFGVARISHFTLFSSRLRAEGSRYSIENSWNLGD